MDKDLEVLNVSGIGAVDVEEAVGAVRRAFPNASQVQQAAIAANNLSKKAYKNSLMTRAMKFLAMNAHKLSADCRNAINTGNGRWEEADYYIRKEVSAGNGIPPLIKSGDKETVGITNINSNRLPKGTNLSVDKLRLSWAKHATITDPSKVAYSNTDATVDAAILNGELRIDIAGKPVLKMPMAAFFNTGGAYSAVQGNFDVRTLQRPFLVPEDTSIDVSIQLPDGSTLAGVHTFLEVRMMGASLVTG